MSFLGGNFWSFVLEHHPRIKVCHEEGLGPFDKIIIIDWIYGGLYQTLEALYVEPIIHSHHITTGGGRPYVATTFLGAD